MAQSALRDISPTWWKDIKPQAPQKPVGQQMSDVLGGMALATAPFPVVGDVAGAVSDAAMYAAYPEERTMLNAGMSLAGLLPFVPGAGGVRSVKSVAEEAMNTNPGLKLDIYGTPETGYTLSRIEVPKDQRNSGIGSSVMNSIVEAADHEGARVALSPSADFGGNKKRLEDFYQRFGFTSNKGKSKDFSTMETMLRQPRPVQRAELDMSQAARMQRSIDQNFANRNFYHATTEDFPAFKKGKMGSGASMGTKEKAVWMSSDPDVSDTYLPGQFVNRENVPDSADIGGGVGRYYAEGSNIMPLRVSIDPGKISWWDMGGARYEPEQVEEILRNAKREGMEAVAFKNIRDEGIMGLGRGKGAMSLAVFDPANIRSRFAAFDPAKRSSANLSAGIMGGAVGLSALRNINQQEEK